MAFLHLSSKLKAIRELFDAQAAMVKTDPLRHALIMIGDFSIADEEID